MHLKMPKLFIRLTGISRQSSNLSSTSLALRRTRDFYWNA